MELDTLMTSNPACCGRDTPLREVAMPFLQDLLGTEPLSPGDLAIACALSALGYAVMRVQRRWWPERHGGVTRPRNGPSRHASRAT